MDDRDRTNIQAFLAKWQGSQGNERANYQTFFDDLCGALGVERPIPKGTVKGDLFVLIRRLRFFIRIGKKLPILLISIKRDIF